MSAEVEVAAPAGRRRRVAAWVAIGVVLVLVGGVGAMIAGSGEWSQRDALDPESAGALGTRALSQILEEHGVDVEVVRDHAAAATALDDEPATLVLTDTPALSDEGLLALTDAAHDVVLIAPRSRTLDLLIPGAEPAGFADAGAIDPECDFPDAERAGAVQPDAVFSAPDDVLACYPGGDGFGLLAAEHGDGIVAAVDGTALLTNEDLAENGNAALGVNLMGRNGTVVWYQPGPGDTDLTSSDPSLGDLTPPWVSPVIVLLLAAGVAAAIWRGRRFGPLVAERLPVTVRATETTEGRARLYAHSRDAVHAADQLRLGALERIGRLLGLGNAASASEIADAAAARTGLDRAGVHGVLYQRLPAGDAELVVLSQQLRHLEDAVHAAVRPERNDPR